MYKGVHPFVVVQEAPREYPTVVKTKSTEVIKELKLPQSYALKHQVLAFPDFESPKLPLAASGNFLWFKTHLSKGPFKVSRSLLCLLVF